MGNIKIRRGAFDTKLKLEHAGIFEGDRINRMQGCKTVVLGAQQYTRKDGRSTSGRLLPTGRKNAIRHDYLSKNPTTRWSDVIKLK